jgi:hypothetical protein
MNTFRLLVVGVLAVLAHTALAQGARPAFSESFEGLSAPAKGMPLTLPTHWTLATYGDGTKPVAESLIATGPDGKKALRYTGTIATDGTYWGVMLSTPAVPTKVETYGVPTRLTFDVRSAAGRQIEVLVHSQDQAYEETGTLSSKLTLKAGEWTKVEIALNGSATLGNFSVLDPHLVFLIHIGNNQGYGHGDTIDITIDNVVLHSLAP